MKQNVNIFFKYFFFWQCYFWFSSVVFLLSNIKLTQELEALEIAKTLILGTRMSLSMTGYLTIIPGVIIALSFIFKAKKTRISLRVYTFVLLIASTILNVIDLGLYPHWKTRIGINAFDYIEYPQAVFANISLCQALISMSIFAGFIVIFTVFFNKFIDSKVKRNLNTKWHVAPLILFMTASLIIPIRGSFGTSPMNLSFVAFSNKAYANQAATNYLWHFFQTVSNRQVYENPSVYFTPEQAKSKFNFIEDNRSESDTIIISKNNNDPNVILVILESFSNKVIPALGGKFNVCPNLNSLCDSSIVFSSFYAAGNRSDRGISAILGSYPSLLESSIMRFPDKAAKLSPISHYFKAHSYKTSFYYGGDINFYNLKTFLLHGDYDNIIGQNHFLREIREMSSWGVPDEYLFEKVLEDLNDNSQPFFDIIYTLSSHPPFDVPYHKIEGSSNEAKFLNAAAYTDSCLGKFISDLKEMPVWDKTLVIITADHAYTEPGQTEVNEPDSYKIPLIWTGGMIESPTEINNTGGQIDIAPTLIRQLGWEYNTSMFGHDLFSTPSYAFYMHDTGWGYITPGNSHFYDRQTTEFIKFETSSVDSSYFDFPKAYLQLLHDDFIKK